MINRYLILFATGFIGALFLLALQIFTRRRALDELVTASWLLLLVVLWLTLPLEGRWVISLWRPSTILSGQLLMDLTPGIWHLWLALALTFAGVAWVQVADGRAAKPLSGVVTLGVLLATWLALAGGSLLTVLAAWALFDLLWGGAGLIVLNDSERVTFGWLLNGLSSVILWMVMLLLEWEGGSTLWWLMVPTRPVKALLIGAALLRIGLYPFHISFPRRIGVIDPLFLISSMNPVLGLGLLYRLLSLPGVRAFPQWLAAFGAVTLLWGGVSAWKGRSVEVPLRAAYALLGVIVVGTVAAGQPVLLLQGAATWFAGLALLWLSRPGFRQDVIWSWPRQMALLFFLGVPPSVLGTLYRSALVGQGWAGRVVLLLGGILVSVALFRFSRRRNQASVAPPWLWQQVSLAVGFALPLLGLVGWPRFQSVSLIGILFWGGVLVAAAGWLWWRKRRPLVSERLGALWDFLDLRWVHRSLWRGAEHVLGAVRIVAEVVEGSGAMLWSMLVVLIVLLIRGVD